MLVSRSMRLMVGESTYLGSGTPDGNALMLTVGITNATAQALSMKVEEADVWTSWTQVGLTFQVIGVGNSTVVIPGISKKYARVVFEPLGSQESGVSIQASVEMRRT
jgi:hypothetical protein